jgi:hypothetical protein
MADAAWKKFERRIAEIFPDGRRRGPDTQGERNQGKTDVVSPGWAIECKLLKTVSFGILLNAALQAERNRLEPDDIPIAIVKEYGRRDENALVVAQWSTFMDYFNPHPTSTGWHMSYLPARKPTMNQIWKTVVDSERGADSINAIPIAKIDKYGTEEKIAVMRLPSFTQHFVSKQ